MCRPAPRSPQRTSPDAELPVDNADDFALVKSINEIAHLMGKKTIAEYAESNEVISQLKEIGVDYLQGFAVSKPMLLEEIGKSLKPDS